MSIMLWRAVRPLVVNAFRTTGFDYATIVLFSHTNECYAAEPVSLGVSQIAFAHGALPPQQGQGLSNIMHAMRAFGANEDKLWQLARDTVHLRMLSKQRLWSRPSSCWVSIRMNSMLGEPLLLLLVNVLLPVGYSQTIVAMYRPLSGCIAAEKGRAKSSLCR